MMTSTGRREFIIFLAARANSCSCELRRAGGGCLILQRGPRSFERDYRHVPWKMIFRMNGGREDLRQWYPREFDTTARRAAFEMRQYQIASLDGLPDPAEAASFPLEANLRKE